MCSILNEWIRNALYWRWMNHTYAANASCATFISKIGERGAVRLMRRLILKDELKGISLKAFWRFVWIHKWCGHKFCSKKLILQAVGQYAQWTGCLFGDLDERNNSVLRKCTVFRQKIGIITENTVFSTFRGAKNCAKWRTTNLKKSPKKTTRLVLLYQNNSLD